MFTIPKGAQGNLLITLTWLIMGIRILITLVPRAFLFVDKCEDLKLVLLCKGNLEHKEIRASDWLKHPISMLIILFFHVLHSRFGFAIQKAYLKFEHRQHRAALYNDIGNFMVPHFYPIGNSTG